MTTIDSDTSFICNTFRQIYGSFYYEVGAPYRLSELWRQKFPDKLEVDGFSRVAEVLILAEEALGESP